MCKLSIITINRNNAEGLRQTIESVVCQTYTDLEFIIIDGASTDGSVAIIEKYSDKITYWISEPDRGIYNAMNKGILKANGEYCLFLNSGDWLYSTTCLQELFLHDFIQDIVCCDRKSLENFCVIGEMLYPDKITFETFFNGTIGHQSTVIKRSLFETIGLYNETNKYASDWEFFMIALARYNCTYMHLSLFLCNYDVTGISGQQNNWNEMQEERNRVMQLEFPLFYDDYQQLKKEKQYHIAIKNRNVIRRIKDFILYLKKSPNFDR